MMASGPVKLRPEGGGGRAALGCRPWKRWLSSASIQVWLGSRQDVRAAESQAGCRCRCGRVTGRMHVRLGGREGAGATDAQCQGTLGAH